MRRTMELLCDSELILMFFLRGPSVIRNYVSMMICLWTHEPLLTFDPLGCNLSCFKPLKSIFEDNHLDVSSYFLITTC